MKIAGSKLSLFTPILRQGSSLLTIAALLFTTLTAGVTAQQKQQVRTIKLNEEQRIMHVLNRLGFGARPGDLERVKAFGLESYINKQLSRESISDSLAEAMIYLLSTRSM